ncbi:MAG: ATP-dependent helicase HrpB [Acidimicrobiales bacterium]
MEDVVDDVRAALAHRGRAVLQAEPGAGKTTVVPLRLLGEAWLGGRDRIVVLEPRRLAARAAARRMAALLGEEVGGTVGYRTRDEQRVGPGTRIEVVTEGILTRRLQRDASLPGTALVVFDEVHERNLQTDLALALAIDAAAVLRPDLRLLAMSATLDTDRVAALLGRVDGEGPVPVIRSAGRSHPVDVRWRPPRPRQRLAEATADAVRHALRSDEGDVLVFLAGAADIRRVEGLLGDLPAQGVDVRPLFGALPPADQDAALAPSPPGRRRVVLATDIAETSLTVDGVRVVVDAGQVRTPRLDPRTGLTALHTGTASRASAEQRTGRAGRLGPGVAHRLWSKVDHAARPRFAEPEIATADLCGFALELATWGGDGSDLAFLDPPPARTLAEARALLAELDALDEHGRPTQVGSAMAELPVHPRLARMLVLADRSSRADSSTPLDPSGRRALACVLAALLDERDVLRGHPDEVPTDVADRLAVVLGDRRDPRADRGAVAGVRRRAGDLGRRVGLPSPRQVLDAASGVVGDAGPLLALAYPDRLAQARGNGRFRLRHGTGAWLAASDPLHDAAFLVVASLAGGRAAASGRADHRILVAAALDEADLVAAAGDHLAVVERLGWDDGRDDLRVRRERTIDRLVLATTEGPAEPGPATTAALVDRVRRHGLDELAPAGAARALQARAAFARRVLGDDWPAVDDDALLADLDDWLAPRLLTATRRADLRRVDLTAVVRERLGHHRVAELDRLVPTTLTTRAGRTAAIDYAGDRPTAAVRVQDLFGTTTHPTVAGGRVPIVLHLLSPAQRPIQVTADLPGFWAGSWTEVRKDMAGRYPKHDWPTDPSTASPPSRRGGAGRDRGRR